MTKFVYASPIISEKSQVVRYVYRQKRENPQLAGDDAAFQKALGIERWQAWLQKSSRGDYFIHYLETENLDKLFARLKHMIQEEKPRAIWLRDFYLEVLGRDYSDLSAMPNLVQLFDTALEDTLPERGEIVGQGFVLPLLPKKLDAYKEFCRQIRGEHLGRVQESCRQFHITKMSLFLQKSITHDYIVTYRERVLVAQEQAKRPHEVRASNAAYQWLTNQLMDLTGLPFDQLEPHLEYLTPQPLATLHQWSSPQLARR